MPQSEATVAGAKTVRTDTSPSLTAATLNTILATAPENLTVAQLGDLTEAVRRVSGGGNPAAYIGDLLN